MIKTFFLDIIRIAKTELKNIFKDPGVLILFFGAGLIYPVLYGYVYKNEAVHQVPIAVVDMSNTATSRSFIRKIDATPDVVVEYKTLSMSEAKKLYAEEKVMGIILIPERFSSDIHKGEQTVVPAYVSMASLFYYRAVYSAINYVSLDMDKKIHMQRLIEKGATEREAEVASTPVLNNGIALFNSKGGYASFLLPCVLVLIIQQSLALGIGVLAGTARERNLSRSLVPMQGKYHGTLRVIFGKSLTYFVIYVFISWYDLVAITHLFNLPHVLNLVTFIGFVLPYVIACVFYAMAISIFFFSREEVFLFYLFLSVPMLFISGNAWPTAYIPKFWSVLSEFLPSTFGIRAFVKLNTAGATIGQISPELVRLWIQAGVYFLATFFMYRWQIKSSEQKE